MKFVRKIFMYWCCSVSQPCQTLCDPMDCSTPGFPDHHQLPESTQTHVQWVGDATQLSYPLSSPSPPALNLSQHQGLFRWVSSPYQVAKVLEFQLSISTSNEYSGLISFRIDWLDLLAVQGTLKSLLQHHSSKASILQRSAFFIVQLSHPYMTTGKTIALTRWTFVDKVMSQVLNKLRRWPKVYFPKHPRLMHLSPNFQETDIPILYKLYQKIGKNESCLICFMNLVLIAKTEDKENYRLISLWT